ncbi:MAG: hypothetical protein N3G19_00355 [Candidatus Pacearchaeota archaeon]|nr:hypothetical protein [Candidatus Pacearchaeota archaeon]
MKKLLWPILAIGIFGTSYWLGILQDLRYEIILSNRGRLAKRKIEDKLSSSYFERFWEFGKTYCEGGKISGNYYRIYFKKNPEFLKPIFRNFNITKLEFPEGAQLDESFMYANDMLTNKILEIEVGLKKELSVLEKEIKESGVTFEVEKKLIDIFSPILGKDKTKKIISIAADQDLSPKEFAKKIVDEVPIDLSKTEEKFVKEVVKELFDKSYSDE